MDEPDLVAQRAYIPFARIEKNLVSAIQIVDTILIVEPSLLHVCSISNLEIFSNLLYCVAVTQEDVVTVKSKYNIPENDTLAVLLSRN